MPSIPIQCVLYDDFEYSLRLSFELLGFSGGSPPAILPYSIL